jgi:Ca2+/Na+ antiporter
MYIATIADKYLTVGMADLAQRFKLSPAVTAMTLIVFANGAPDILVSMGAARKAEEAFIAIGLLFEEFMFSCTLVVSNVVWNSPDQIVYLPKLVIMKGLGRQLTSVFCLIIFRFGKTKVPLHCMLFVHLFWLCYCQFVY